MFHGIVHNRFTKTIKAWLSCYIGRMGRFVSLESYAHDNPTLVRFINSGIEQTIYSEPRLALSDKSVIRQVDSVNTFVAIIKDACCFAYSDLIMLSDKTYYCELKEDPLIGNSFDCSDGYVLMADEKSYYSVAIPEKEKKLDSGIFLSGLYSWNYYHFTFQVLPKLQMVGTIDSVIPLLVDKKVKEIPSFAALLTVCNKQSRPVVVMEERVSYCVNNLYYVSAQTYLESNHKKGTPYIEVRCRYLPSALRFLRETMIPVAQHEEYPKRVFIGRKYVTSGRRHFNEDACMACAKEFGFEIVFPEFLTLEQQIGLFNNAEMIIGGSGAAFTNLIYCKKGVKVIVLSKYRIGFWQTIVDFIGGDLLYVCETNKVNHNPKKVHDSFSIDVERLRRVIDEMQ